VRFGKVKITQKANLQLDAAENLYLYENFFMWIVLHFHMPQGSSAKLGEFSDLQTATKFPVSIDKFAD